MLHARDAFSGRGAEWCGHLGGFLCRGHLNADRRRAARLARLRRLPRPLLAEVTISSKVRSTRTSVPLLTGQASAARARRLTPSRAHRAEYGAVACPKFTLARSRARSRTQCPDAPVERRYVRVRRPSAVSGVAGVPLRELSLPGAPSAGPRLGKLAPDRLPLSTAYYFQYPTSFTHEIDAALHPAAASRAGAPAP